MLAGRQFVRRLRLLARNAGQPQRLLLRQRLQAGRISASCCVEPVHALRFLRQLQAVGMRLPLRVRLSMTDGSAASSSAVRACSHTWAASAALCAASRSTLPRACARQTSTWSCKLASIACKASSTMAVRVFQRAADGAGLILLQIGA